MLIVHTLILYFYLLLDQFLCLSHCAAEGVDPATVGITPEIISTDPVCPSPMPFLRNTNSSTAILMGDAINGTQPEHAGVYTCYSNGQPQESVEIVVLGINILKYLYMYYDPLCLLQFLRRHHLFLRLSFAFQVYH